MTAVLKTLSDAISDVIEELALMTVDVPECTYGLKAEMLGWIDFEGPVTGRLSARSERQLGAMLASTLLGIDMEDEQATEQAPDALGEMLNIVCGNLVTRMFDATKAFSLSVPHVEILDDQPDQPDHDSQTHPPDSPADDQWGYRETCTLLLDDCPVEFTLNTSTATR